MWDRSDMSGYRSFFPVSLDELTRKIRDDDLICFDVKSETRDLKIHLQNKCNFFRCCCCIRSKTERYFWTQRIRLGSSSYVNKKEWAAWIQT